MLMLVQRVLSQNYGQGSSGHVSIEAVLESGQRHLIALSKKSGSLRLMRGTTHGLGGGI